MPKSGARWREYAGVLPNHNTAVDLCQSTHPRYRWAHSTEHAFGHLSSVSNVALARSVLSWSQKQDADGSHIDRQKKEGRP